MSMNIYVLKRNPEQCDYDHNTGAVVVTHSEKRARVLASLKCGDEGNTTWLDPSKTVAVKLGISYDDIELVVAIESIDG